MTAHGRTEVGSAEFSGRTHGATTAVLDTSLDNPTSEPCYERHRGHTRRAVPFTLSP